MTTPSMSKIRAAIVVTSLAIISMSPAMHAQSSTVRGKVNVPFAFQIGRAHV